MDTNSVGWAIASLAGALATILLMAAGLFTVWQLGTALFSSYAIERENRAPKKEMARIESEKYWDSLNLCPYKDWPIHDVVTDLDKRLKKLEGEK
jgi:hypothetical protein